jgi:phosphate/phosphite/phosphonate ABC transporter binding protein
MSQKMSKTLLAILMVASMVLGACTAPATPAPTQPPAAETAAPAEPMATAAPTAGPYEGVDPTGQTITFWHQHTKGREEALNAMVEEFNQTNEWGITVEAEYQGSYDAIFNKMLGVLNTSDAPNLVVAYQNQAATYQLAEGLVDMSPLVESEKWGLTEEEQADFFPWAFKQDVFPTYGDARLGWPPNRSMEVLYYNSDWLKELGYDGPPTTPAEFKEMACKASKTPYSKATADGPIGYELGVEAGDASRFASWAFAFGGDIFDYNTSQYSYDSQAAKDAFTMLQSMFDEGCAQLTTEAYGDQTDFGAGKLLFAISSSSGLPFYQQAIDEGAQHQWGVAAIPHTTADPAMNIYGASVSMPKTTPEGELAAWLFLKYYTEPENQAKWAEASQYFPVRASVADELGDYFAANPNYKTAFDMLKFGKFEPPVPGYDFVRAKVGEAMAAILDGADVDKTLTDLNTEANAMLAEQETSPLPTPVPTKPPEPTKAPVATDIGTADHPIKVLFVPSVDAAVITAGGDIMAAALKEATGLEFQVSVPTSYAATIEEMCASPTDTMGFIPGLGYVLANQLCGVDVGFKAVRFGSDVYYAQIIVQRDSDIQTLADLEGKKWGYGDAGSTSGYMVPLVMFQEAGIKPGLEVQTGGHSQTVKAVYNGEVDFGTTFFTAALKPEGQPAWKEGDPTDIPDDLIDSCAPTADGKKLMCGDWRVLDARANIREEAPDVIQKVRILAISPAIPNDTLAFGPDFPADLRQKISDALVAFAKTEAWNTSIGSQDFYGWTGINPATDAEYDFVRQMVEAAGLTLEGLGQ